MPGVSRRGFLRCAGVVGLAAGVGAAAACVNTPERPTVAVSSPAAPSPQSALDFLMAGNRRWAAGDARHPNQSPQRRTASVGGQSPLAVVYSCIDSRVPPELVFDCGLGEILVVRTAGQAVGDVPLGSIELGPHAFAAPLVFVLGHQNCGAVLETIAAIQQHEGHAPAHVQAVMEALRPAYDVAAGQQGDLVDNMVRAQTRLTTELLKQDELLVEGLHTGHLAVVGGRYDLATGRVDIIA